MYHLIGFGVTFAISSSIFFVARRLPWPSAISTPSLPTTNRLTVVKPGLPDLFVAVDVVGELDGAREIGELEAALVGIGGADLRA